MPEPSQFFQTCFGVFQGGGCRAAAFVGAVQEAVRRRVSFAGVAGTSAGSIVAALIGAGATPQQLQTLIADLDFRQFTGAAIPVGSPSKTSKAVVRLLKFTRLGPAGKVWLQRGLYSSVPIETWTNRVLSDLTGIRDRNVRFGDLAIPTWVVATDIVSRDVKTWSTWATPEDEVGYAVRCSCSIPGFFQPVSDRFVDGGVLSNLPAFVFQHANRTGHAPLATRTLAFTVRSSADAVLPTNTEEAVRAIVDTVIDGATHVQQRMLDVHVIEISTGRVKATDFDSIAVEDIRTLLRNGARAAQAFFDDELSRVRSSTAPTAMLRGSDEIFAAAAARLDDSRLQHVWIIDARTRWLYAIYPSVLYWIMNGVSVTVVWQHSQPGDAHEDLRRRLLKAMGATVLQAAHLPFRGYLFDPTDDIRGEAIVHVESIVDNNEVRAIRYIAPLDGAAIRSLFASIQNTDSEVVARDVGRPTIVTTTSDELVRRLRQYIPPYGHQAVHLESRRLPVNELVSLSKVVKGFKYQQIEYLRQLFVRAALAPFQLAVARYANGSETILTPAVAEISGGPSILIQGNTRALYSYKHELEEIDCIVVRNVAVPLPSNQRVAIKHMLIGDRTLTTHDRYGSDIDRDYRQIELASHHPSITLV